MSPRDLAPAMLGGLTALLSLSLLAQLGHRADRAADAVSAVRRDGGGVHVLLDRAANAGVLGAGWDRPALNEGARSNAPMTYLALPTSTGAGDVELTLVLARDATAERNRPVAITVGQTAIGTWVPRSDGEETLRLRVPAAARAQSYEVIVGFDLTGGRANAPPPPPLRVVKAETRIAPAT